MTQRMRLVPEVATEEMCHALAGDCDWNAVKGGFQADYEALIAASPNAGCVTASKKAELLEVVRKLRRENAYSPRVVDEILTALGLRVADTPAGELGKHGNA